MSMIELFNKNVSDAINKHDELYEAWFGKEDFTPEVIVVESDDINCGALCNELEYARLATDYYVKSLDMSQAEHDELTALAEAMIDLPRRGSIESDTVYRNRFNFLVVDQTNKRRLTRWAILDAMKYFINDVNVSVQLIEPFSAKNLYFQIRIEGFNDTAKALTLDSINTGFIGQNFLTGLTIGSVVTYLNNLIQRVKAAGVDFDIIFILQDRITKTSNAFIGSVQLTKTINARIKGKSSITKSSNATII